MDIEGNKRATTIFIPGSQKSESANKSSTLLSENQKSVSCTNARQHDNIVLFNAHILHAGVAYAATEPKDSCRLSLSFIPSTLDKQEMKYYESVCNDFGIHGLKGQGKLSDQRELQ